MIKKLILLLIVTFNLNYIANAEQKDFFNDAKELYEKESYDDSKFLFQRNIVYLSLIHI